MATRPTCRYAIGVVAVLAFVGSAWGGETPPGCGQWEAPDSGRVGEVVTIGSTSVFGGDTVDVRLGSTAVATGPFGTGNVPPDWFIISFTIPEGTPVGITGLGIRTRTSGQFGFPNCDWQVRQFEVLPTFVLGGTTSTTAAPPPSATSTTATTVADSDTESTSTLAVTTTSSGVATSAATTTSSTGESVATPSSASSGDGSGGISGLLMALLAAAGAAAFFGLGALWRSRRGSG